MTLRGRYSYCSYFTDVDPEAKKVMELAQGHRTPKRGELTLNLAIWLQPL